MTIKTIETMLSPRLIRAFLSGTGERPEGSQLGGEAENFPAEGWRASRKRAEEGSSRKSAGVQRLSPSRPRRSYRSTAANTSVTAPNPVSPAETAFMIPSVSPRTIAW